MNMKSILTAALFAASVVSGYAGDTLDCTAIGDMKDYGCTTESLGYYSLFSCQFHDSGQKHCQNAHRCARILMGTGNRYKVGTTQMEEAFDCYMSQRHYLRLTDPLVNLLVGKANGAALVEFIKEHGSLELLARAEWEHAFNQDIMMHSIYQPNFTHMSLTNWLILVDAVLSDYSLCASSDECTKVAKAALQILKEKVFAEEVFCGAFLADHDLHVLEHICSYLVGEEADDCDLNLIKLSDRGLSGIPSGCVSDESDDVLMFKCL